MSAPIHNRAPPANMSAVTHNRAPSQLQNPQYRTGILNDFRNSHLQHTLNPQAHQPMKPLNTQLSRIQQGSSQANAAGPAANSQQARNISHAARQGNSQAGIVWTAGATVYSEQARAIAAALAARQSQSISSQNQTCLASTYFTADSFWGLTGEQRGPPVQAVSRTDELFNSQPDQNWRPTRMRGSLSGEQLTEQVRQKLIMPSSHEVQSSRPQAPPPGRTRPH
ncbi:transcription factor [Trifolium pratense]|uniref:Transcription factor n=2 Tax=Trifolium pratense TaxID=57577 RepID=A0A2K3LJP4_TRIPR|nr:transcription factor [Trifolium pratense]